MHWSLPLQIDKMPSPVSLKLEEENDHTSILLAIYLWFSMFTMYQDHGLWWIWFRKSIPSRVTTNIHKTYIRFDETLNYICHMVLEFLSTSGLDTARWKQRVETWEGFPLLLLLPLSGKKFLHSVFSWGQARSVIALGCHTLKTLNLAITLCTWLTLTYSGNIALGHHNLKTLHLARPNFLKTLCL